MSHIHTEESCPSPVDDVAQSPPRTLILCFDGTSDKYDEDCTNVVKLYSLFNKDHVDEQLCYYQERTQHQGSLTFISSIGQWVAKTLDKAVAWYLYQHILDGYQFLMRNYKAGDQVCLFGFSRGAYTARALAGMLHKVGLLSKDNTEQIPFAYQLYASDNKLVNGFKETFCRNVPIAFVGVWDTVASTGINGPLPFAGVNTTIRVFRHALALDEHRVNFAAEYYHRNSEKKVATSGLGPSSKEEQVSDVQGNESKIIPPQMDEVFKKPDVREVWFVGCHADVGGGVMKNEEKGLSDISLRWMVREIVKAGVKVIFDGKALKVLDIPVSMIMLQPTTDDPQPQHPETNGTLINRKKRDGYWNQTSPEHYSLDVEDVKATISDQLEKVRAWRLLEKLTFHFGRGRQVPSNPCFHESVRECMKHGYKPKAEYKQGEETYVY
ncbi:hypothetical protein EDB85DRAFT_1884840 [Lactarius pseudohatsudake]|nr:hypothetical protein EDB85DRAFT_1884840 [Lactarius pseudohatsudake]